MIASRRRRQLIQPEEHFAHFSRLLDLESSAETRRIAERRNRSQQDNPEATGESLVGLVVANREPALGGRALLSLVKRKRGPWPWHRLRVGSPVVVSGESNERDATQGVVSGRSSKGINVTVDDWPQSDVLRVDLSSDEVTRKRQRSALSAAERATGRFGVLRDVLLGLRDPSMQDADDVDSDIHGLNPSQESAVRFALSAEDVAVIHGPPGTGKTTTVVQFIRAAVGRGENVLACAPSNTAVDNILEKVHSLRLPVVRIGHPARVEKRLQKLTLDGQAVNHDAMKIVREMLREAEGLHRRLHRHTRARPARGEKHEMWQEAQRLRHDARLLEQHVIQDVIDRSAVVCATTNFDQGLLGDRHFEWLVIDEACQSIEPGCWIPLGRANRLVLAGDHCQLPPTVISDEAARTGLQVSLMERLVDRFDDRITRTLDIQYRMHEKIMDFSSAQFYEGRMRADASVASHVLSDLEHVQAGPQTTTPVTFIDTAGANWDEEQEPDAESRRNPREASLVVKTVNELLQQDLRAREVAVITPYAAQTRQIRDLGLHRDVEVDTVDGFQGREKEAIVISCVRSNSRGEIGFLADTRRMNVALTRARRRLIVIGDSATLGGHPFYAGLLEYFESIDAYHTVWEFEDT